MTESAFLIFLVVFFFAAAYIRVSMEVSDRLRSCALENKAREMGYSYYGSLALLSQIRVNNFYFANQLDCIFKNVVVPSPITSHNAIIFDCYYCFKKYSLLGTLLGKRPQLIPIMSVAYALIDDGQGDMPRFVMSRVGSRPELSSVGQKIVSFSDHPIFSKLYRVSGDDEHAIRQFFSEKTIKFFEISTACWFVECNGKAFAISDYKSYVTESLEDYIARVTTVADLFVKCEGN